MTEEVSYFEVTSFLAEIEADYADIGDREQRLGALAARVQEKWPALTAQQALAYVRLFNADG